MSQADFRSFRYILASSRVLCNLLRLSVISSLVSLCMNDVKTGRQDALPDTKGTDGGVSGESRKYTGQ
jgi:hypothetical protein